MLDTDAVAASILEACVAAGPSLCPIWENSTELVDARVHHALNALRFAPLPIFNDTDPAAATFAVVDYATAFDGLFESIYFPYSEGPAAAAAIAALEQGDGSLVYSLSIESELNVISQECTNSSQPFGVGFLDIVAPVLCGDAIVDRYRSLAQAREDYAAMRNLSIFADVWYPTSIEACA